MEIMREDAPEAYRGLINQYGKRGVTVAEKQLTLYLSIQTGLPICPRWKQTHGIHLMVIGGKSPMDEYRRFTVSVFNEITADIRSNVVSIQKCTITENGIDMDAAGLSGGTTTWTIFPIREGSTL